MPAAHCQDWGPPLPQPTAPTRLAHPGGVLRASLQLPSISKDEQGKQTPISRSRNRSATSFNTERANAMRSGHCRLAATLGHGAPFLPLTAMGTASVSWCRLPGWSTHTTGSLSSPPRPAPGTRLLGQSQATGTSTPGQPQRREREEAIACKQCVCKAAEPAVISYPLGIGLFTLKKKKNTKNGEF